MTKVIAWAVIILVFVACAKQLDNTQVQPTPAIQKAIITTDYQIEMARDFLTEEEYFRGYVLLVYNDGSSSVADIYEVRLDSTMNMVDAQYKAMVEGYTRSKRLKQQLLKNSTPPNK